jgi:molybdenum-dependent DNA-binding transcriptional regulator ModE
VPALIQNKRKMSFKYTPNTLKKLEQLFEEARYRVRYEKGNFNSGFCVLEDRRIAVINRFLNVEGRINALVEILPTLQVNEEELSGEMLKWYRQLMDNPGAEGNQSVQTQMDI